LLPFGRGPAKYPTKQWLVRNKTGYAGGRGGRISIDMASNGKPVTIKRYPNRRLYNTGTGTYVTVEDLGCMVEDEEDFVVFDAQTGQDITRSMLKAIIIERARHG
jgi:PHB/PHA accumulation regulator DNA-binding domain